MIRGDRPARWWLIAVFAAGLATRLAWISVPLNIDETLWMQRGPAFLQSVLLGERANAYLYPHPGVTNMWLIGGALASRYLLRGWLPPSDLARQAASLPQYLGAVAQLPVVPLALDVQARIVAALVTAACAAGIFALSWRLFGGAVALIAAAIMLLEPFYLGYQRFVTTDANQSNFTWLALLAFLLCLREVAGHPAKVLRWAALAGLFFGLAVLSKVTALLSLPAFGLAVAWCGFRLRSRRAWLRLLWGVLAGSLVAAGVAFLLWPALRVDPQGTLSRLVTNLHAEVGSHVQFFLGRTVEDPGLPFYPLVMVYRLSPLLWCGALLGLVALAVPALRRRLRDRTSLAVIVVELACVLFGLSLAGSKLDRYIVPLVPGMALLAASGIDAGMSRLAEMRWADAGAGQASALSGLTDLRVVLGAVLVIQLATVLPHVPYYVTFFNPLVGGPAVAQKLLMVGNGELMDRAAAWVDKHVGGGEATVAAWYPASFSAYHQGPTLSLDPWSWETPEVWRRANFVVLYVNMTQRRDWAGKIVDYFEGQRPLYEAKANGVSYAQVYSGPAVRDADLAALASRVDFDFQGDARLVGYDLEAAEVPAGDTATVALYWQGLRPFPAGDFSVHLGLEDAEGNEWGGTDGAPVGGMLPVDQWQSGQVVRDVHRVRVPPGTPPGQYRLDVSFWSASLGQALEVSDHGGLVGRSATLPGPRVISPARPPSLDEDLQIANRVEGEVRVAPGAARLVGYELPHLTTVRAGDAIPLTLLWQGGTKSPAGVQLRLRLSKEGVDRQRRAGHPVGGGNLPQTWTPGQLVRDRWEALLPADAPPGLSRLSLVADTPDGEQVLLDLGNVEVLAREHDFLAPNPQFSERVALGDVARLVGYSLPDEAQPGQVLSLALYWQALGESEHNYARFVHVLDGDNHIVAQSDGVPGKGRAPLTSWLPSEYIRDDVQISLPPDLPAGTYRFEAGMYDPVSGSRLAAGDGGERILLSQSLVVR